MRLVGVEVGVDLEVCLRGPQGPEPLTPPFLRPGSGRTRTGREGVRRDPETPYVSGTVPTETLSPCDSCDRGTVLLGEGCGGTSSIRRDYPSP